MDIRQKKQLAIAEDTPADTLEQLSKDIDEEILKLVARNPNTDIKILEKLSYKFPEAVIGNPIFDLLILENTDSYLVKSTLARSSTTPQPVLKKLANDRDSSIRRIVAENRQTNVELLWLLTKDVDSGVRRGVASNTNLPLEIFLYLAKDKDISIREAVAQNSHTPTDILESLARNQHTRIRLAIANNHDTPLELLNKLAKDKSHEVCLAVIRNPQTLLIGRKILKRLTRNKNREIARAAQEVLNIA